MEMRQDRHGVSRRVLASLGLLAALALGATGRSAEMPGSAREPNAAQHDEHVLAHWAYLGVDGPEHWAILTPAYMGCEAGSHQSPIDIHMPRHARAHGEVILDYPESTFNVVNNGHTIQAVSQKGGTLRHGGRLYRLQQLHFHEPSEHRIEGTPFPMEMHLVHRDDTGHIVVVGVLLTIGRDNDTLEKLWSRLPGEVGATVTSDEIRLAQLLPADPHHYTYQGSLTTPPCTEGVRWIVLSDPVILSAAQVSRFVQVIGHNARPVQPLHERPVSLD